MQEREKYLKQLNAELDAIDAQLDQFRAERPLSGLNVPGGTDAEIRELKRREDEIRRRADQLEETGDDDAWREDLRGIEAAWSELKASVSRVRDRLRY